MPKPTFEHLKLAVRVRNASEEHHTARKTLANFCGPASLGFALACQVHDLPCGLAWGLFRGRLGGTHWWNLVGDDVWDLTRTQYVRKAPRVSVIKPGDTEYDAYCGTNHFEDATEAAGTMDPVHVGLGVVVASFAVQDTGRNRVIKLVVETPSFGVVSPSGSEALRAFR